MSIADGELKIYKPLVITNDETNGGNMSGTAITSGVVNNIFPNVFKSERVLGSTLFRKIFCKVHSVDDFPLYNPDIWLDIVTPGDDSVVMIPGAWDGVQGGNGTDGDIYDNADVYLPTRVYGCAVTDAIANSSDTSVSIVVEDVDYLDAGGNPMFVIGDTIRITDKVTIDSAGNEETQVLTGVSDDGGVTMTLTFAGGSLANTYAAGSKVQSVYQYEDEDTNRQIMPFMDNPVIGPTVGTKTFDETKIEVDNKGGVFGTFKCLMTDNSGNFDLYLDGVDTGLSGSITAGITPTNPLVSERYFFIDTYASGNSPFNDYTNWATNDYVEFDSHPAAIPMWLRRNVPAGASSLNGNKTTVVFAGESE